MSDKDLDDQFRSAMYSDEDESDSELADMRKSLVADVTQKTPLSVEQRHAMALNHLNNRVIEMANELKRLKGQVHSLKHQLSNTRNDLKNKIDKKE